MTGSFDYDADTDTYSNIHLVTVLSGSTGYTIFRESFGPDLLDAWVSTPADLTGAYIGLLAFGTSLTNDGGTIGVTAVENVCVDDVCSGFSAVSLGSGTVTAPTSSSTEPATFVLVGGGLATVALRRRRVV